MSKGMLILDEMPDCCKRCNFDIISLNENEISCCKLHELINYEHLCVDGYDDRRHEKCPLTVLPE